MRESKSPGPASASRGAKTPLRGVFRAGEIPAQFFVECQLRAGHARPLQGSDGEMGDGGRFRRGVGTPPYARIFKWGCRAASPLAAVEACNGGKLPGRDESLPYELTARGIWRRGAGRACPALTGRRWVNGRWRWSSAG